MWKKIKKISVLSFARFGFKLLFLLVKIFPLPFLYKLSQTMSVLLYMLSSRNRRLAFSNLTLAFGKDLGSARLRIIAKDSFKTMGQTVIDTAYYKQLAPTKVREAVKIEGLEYLKDSLKKNKGVIIVSAHLGSFTLLGYRLILDGYKINFVARHMRDRKMEHIFLSLCRDVGLKIVFNRPALACMRQCISVLSRNEILAIELDQNFGREGVPVIFLGRQAMVASGPLMLSLRTQADILPVFIIKNKDYRHLVKIEPSVRLVLSGNTQKDIQNNVQKIVLEVEKYIRRYPGQWTSWIHKRWETA